MKKVTDKSIPIGNTNLFNKNEWLPFDTMNTEKKILNNTIFDEALNRIINQFKPKHNTAFLSLCTTTRPYNIGKKWKEFEVICNDKADMIVISNGGIIPKKYWESWPYLNYDGDPHVDPQTDLYIDILEKRLMLFFKNVKYDYVVCNFRPTLRNRPAIESAMKALKSEGFIKDYVVIPDEILYNDVQSRGFPKGMIFPDLDLKVIKELKSAVDKYSTPSNSFSQFWRIT